MASVSCSTEGKLAYTCSYVPEEIIRAAGFQPLRIRPERNPSEADTHIYPNTCGYLKSLLAHGLYEDMSGVEGIVFANCCDGMRRLRDIWEHYVSAVPSFFIDVPKKKDPLSVEFFATEFKRFAAGIQNRFGASRETETSNLQAAIKRSNKLRKKMTGLFSQMGKNGVTLKGDEIYSLCHEKADVSDEALSGLADRILTGAAESTADGNTKGVILSGSDFRTPDLISLVEKSGGTIVGFDTCMTTRRFEGLVEDEASDPYMALAERYLTRPPCPRMDTFEDRCEHLVSLIRESGARALIYAPLKFCDTFQYDTLLLLKRFKEAGIPLLILENDYQASVPEQDRTRIQALIENLS